jgi:hypothetical protein
MKRPKAFIVTFCLTLTLIVAECGAQTERTTDHSGAGSLDQGTDHCPALTISSLPYTDTGTTQGRINDYSGSCVGATGRDVIYQYTPVVTQMYRISLCGSSYDTGLYLRTGGACPGTTEVACNNDFCGTQSELLATLAAGATYFIIVDGNGTSFGNYALTVTAAPPGDNCANPRIVDGLPFCDCQSTASFANDYTPPAECLGPGGSSAPDVVYSFTPTDSITTSVSLCGSSFNTILSVWRGCPNAPESQLIACNDDSRICGTTSVIQGITFLAGVNYIIVVDGRGSASGQFALNIAARESGPGTTPPIACSVTCPPGATHEGETWVPNVIDNFNGGFFGNGTFTPIACGQTMCGTSSYTATGERDLDAYRLTLPSNLKAVVCITTEFEADIYVSDSIDCG